MVAFGTFCNAFLSARAKAVLRRLSAVEGLSTYGAVKLISKKEKLATSTVKYVLRKLKRAGVIEYNGKIELTQLGLLLVEVSRGDSLTQQSSRLQTNPFSYEEKVLVNPKRNADTDGSGSEARSPQFEVKK